MQTSKAFALLQGRNYVTTDDVKMMINHVLRHRLLLTAEAEMSGYTIEDVIKSIVEQVEVPK